MHGEHHLPHLIGALRTTGGFAGRLNRRQQEPDERGDDRDHDEEFNEREPATKPRGPGRLGRRFDLGRSESDPEAGPTADGVRRIRVNVDSCVRSIHGSVPFKERVGNGRLLGKRVAVDIISW